MSSGNDAGRIVIDADEAPPCELLSIIGDTPRAIALLGEQRWPVRRLVALKLLKPDACSFAAVERALAGPPAHPTIAPLLESGYMGGWPYLMTVFFGGGTVTHRYARSGSMASRVQALLTVTEAIALAHAHDLAHGRLTPSNVLCEASEPFAVRIVDFGCNARTAGDNAATEVLIREDVGAILTLADQLLPHETSLERMRRQARSATDLRDGFLELQARLPP